MSVLFADRGHLQPDDSEDAGAEELYAAIKDLPPASQDEVARELARVLYHYQETRRVDPVIHFVESLLMTARLHRNPNYVKGLQVAQDIDEPIDSAMGTDELTKAFEGFWSERSAE